ncbi:probable cytochrome P450 9f2 isoform X3 [Ochlerotatus camptorhynchus]|uniref:probable cytochrome P450 9f2 isoform X3 n=1 Tax=Ochlerotatus camptorhynchus TaxID=644619 RepID=UPI0031E3458A
MVNLFAAVAVGVIVLLLYHYVAKKYQYFLTKPIPCIKPTFLLGIYDQVFFKKVKLVFGSKVLYNSFPDAKIIGLFDFVKPTMMIRDPDAIKQIGVKDFDHFIDHAPLFTQADRDDVGTESLFGNSLVALRGQKWRDMRATLSPAFTGSKMRYMFELVLDCAQSTTEFFREEAKAGRTMEYEMKDLFSRFSTDVIGSVAFGIKVDSLREQDNDFFVKGKAMLNFQNLRTLVKIILLRVAPSLMNRLKVDISSSKMNAYFKGMILDNMKQRKVHGIVRNDMINILMQVQEGALKHQKDEQDAKDAGFATVEESSVGKSIHSHVWSENELVAQCFLFFLAGFDTMSTCLTFLSYELLVNPDIQQKLYEEIMAVEDSLNGKPLSYEVLQKMQYLDMVVSETLRLWPPAPFTDRYCVKDYVYDDGQGTRISINKGQLIWFPITALHHDPKYFPNPDKFDPERFSEQNRGKINPATYIPFGVGPRNCIGSRFALMEVKAVVYHLVKNFTLERSQKSKIPLQLVKSFIGMAAEGGMWLEFKPRA